MRILDTTEVIDLKNQKERWMQLVVIQMWDTKSEPVCYQMRSGNKITYSLVVNEKITDETYQSKPVRQLTPDIMMQIVAMGKILIQPIKNGKEKTIQD